MEQYTARFEADGWTILDGVVETEIGGHSALLSHYPYVGDSHDKSAEGIDRYGPVRPIDLGLPLIHGHVHNEFAERGREFNAGVDARDYRPVSRQRIIDWLDTLNV